MITSYKDVLNHFFIISLLLTSKYTTSPLVCFLNVTIIKVPYWILTLLLLYYSFAYNCNIPNYLLVFFKKFDHFVKLTSATKSFNLIYISLVIYSSLCMFFRACYMINSQFELKYSALDSKVAHEILYGYNLHDDNGSYNNQITFYLESLLEMFLLLVVFGKTVEKHRDDLHKMDRMNPTEHIEEIYRDYKANKSKKLLFTMFQYILMASLVVFNLSVLNLPVLIILLIMLVVPINDPKDCTLLDFINLVNILQSAGLLIFHYMKNLSTLRSREFDNFIGVVNFESNYSMIYLITLMITYANSCHLSKFVYDVRAVKELTKAEKINYKEDSKINLGGVLKLLEGYLYKFSTFGYKILLLIWILLHVCCLMFFNFVILFFGISKVKQVFQKFYLISSFLMSILFIFLQYIYNMRGLFNFTDVRIYKYLEVFGMYKYSKNNIRGEYTNVSYLDERSEDKMRGIVTDMVVIGLLFLFALALRLENRKEEKNKVKRLIAAESNNRSLGSGNIVISTQESHRYPTWLGYLAEKSYILSLLVIFICSIIKLDILHSIYFCFFILLLCVRDTYFIKLWNKALLINSFIIIIVLYFWNILAVNFLNLEKETDPRNEDIFTYLGLKIKPNSIFFVEYWEHILLYIYGYLHHLFYINICHHKRNVNEMNASEENICELLNLYKLPEWTKWITISLVILLMLNLATITPLSFIGFTFFMFALTFLITNLFLITTEKRVINKSLIYVFTVFSCIVLIMKYLISFSFFSNYLTAKLELDNFSDDGQFKYFSIQDFGLDGVNISLKLFVNAILLILLKILYSYDSYHIFRTFDEKDFNGTSHNTVIDNVVFRYFKVFVYQILYLHANKIAFVINALMCLYLESIIGAILFTIVLISLFVERHNGWRYSFVPIVSLSYLVMGLIYVCNLGAFRKWMTKDYEWFGLYDGNSLGLYHDYLPYFILLLSSYLARIAPSYVMFYKPPGGNDQEGDKPQDAKAQCDDEEKSKLKEDSDIKIDYLEHKEGAEGNKNISFILKPTDDSILINDKNDEHVITTLSSIWYNLEFIWYLYGFYIILIAIILISFIKVNILSLIFMSFIGYNSFGLYIRTEYKTEKEDNNKENLKLVRKVWFYFALFLTIFSLLQYFNFMWFPPTWKIDKPWEDFSFFCSKEGSAIYSSNRKFERVSDYDYCVLDWKAWLGIDNYSTRDIFFNFICLFMMVSSLKYFTAREIFNRDKFIYKPEDDFTIIKQSRSVSDSFKYILFVYLKSFILFYITLISIAYSYRYTNMIYGGFLFIAFYLFFKDAALNKQKNNLWKYVQYYNYLVLVGVMLFQTPFLPCPVNRDGRSYIGLDECVDEENRLYQSFLLYEYPKNKIDALYMVMVQTIGMLKLDFKLLIVGNLSLFLIYFVALIQQIIFDHPYQSIVDRYMLREKQINCKSRAFKIVQDTHLHTYNAYRQIFNHSEILLKNKLERLEHKTLEFTNLWRQTNIGDHHESVVKSSEENRKKEEIDVLTEQLIAENLEYGLLEYKVFREKVGQVKEKVKRQMEDERREIKEQEEMEKAEREALERMIQPEVDEDMDNVSIMKSEVEPIDMEKEREELDREFRTRLEDKLKIESEVLFAQQRIKDKEYLYSKDYHGLQIASEQFQRLRESTDNTLLLSSDAKEIELYKSIFHIVEENNIVKEVGDKYEESFWYSDIKERLRETIDKSLLMDLTTRNNMRLDNVFDILFFSIYSNIEIIIIFAFIINHCIDASIMSLIYPITYLGYGMIEYPFTNKHYWKWMIIYSLLIITIKLIYQLPFFCGYPSFAVFNIFNENYCDYYNLSDQQITEGFEYIIGLRKYNGEYSYPKNSGLLSGILLDIIILTLLLIKRSLLKTKGIWNFININDEFTKVPIFEHNKESIEIVEGNGQDVQIESNFYIFIKRLVPELFNNGKKIVYKPGIDLYPFSFASLLVILIYTICFFGSMTGKFSVSITDVLDRQQFSKELVWTILFITTIIVADRMIYKWRSVKSDFLFELFRKEAKGRNKKLNLLGSDEDVNTSNRALIIKLVLHYFLLIIVHWFVFITIPLSTHICFFNNASLMIFYLLCIVYFYISALQIKYGFPMITKGQYFTGSTSLGYRIAFKIYKNVPFLYELRAILDWTITRTSLDLFQWFKMEDAYANLYDVKCDMEARKRRRKGADRLLYEKLLFGLLSFAILMFIVILPMFLFSSFNPSLVENNVVGGRISISLELKEPEIGSTLFLLNLFESRTLKINKILEDNQYEYLKNNLLSNDDMEERKIQKVSVVNYSQLDWILSPPTINSLLKNLERKTDSYINIEWEFKRDYPPNNKVITGTKSFKLTKEQVAIVRNIIFALKSNQKPESYNLQIKGKIVLTLDAFPKVIRLSNKQYKYMKFDTKHRLPFKEMTDLELELIRDNDRDTYWRISQLDIKDNPKDCKLGVNPI
jgi:hypothetical protein